MTAKEYGTLTAPVTPCACTTLTPGNEISLNSTAPGTTDVRSPVSGRDDIRLRDRRIRKCATLVRLAASGRHRLFPTSTESSIREIVFASDGRRVVVGYDDGGAGVLDLPEGRKLKKLDISRVRELSPDGARALDERLDIIDLRTGRRRRLKEVNTESVRIACFMPDGKRVLVEDINAKALRTFDVASGAELGRVVLRGLCDTPNSTRGKFSISPDGKTLAVPFGESSAVRMWDLATGRPLHAHPGHTAPPYCLTFSPDGNELISAGADSGVLRWDLASRKVSEVPGTSETVPSWSGRVLYSDSARTVEAESATVVPSLEI